MRRGNYVQQFFRTRWTNDPLTVMLISHGQMFQTYTYAHGLYSFLTHSTLTEELINPKKLKTLVLVFNF